jgi:hypothetical protein
MAGLKDRKDAIPIQELLRAKVISRRDLQAEFKKIKEDFTFKRDEINELVHYHIIHYVSTIKLQGSDKR